MARAMRELLPTRMMSVASWTGKLRAILAQPVSPLCFHLSHHHQRSQRGSSGRITSKQSLKAPVTERSEMLGELIEKDHLQRRVAVARAAVAASRYTKCWKKELLNRRKS
jgi:hypothetical protein